MAKMTVLHLWLVISIFSTVATLATEVSIGADGSLSEAGTGSVQLEVCKDLDDECEEWQKRGECEMNPDFMRKNCRKSCQICTMERPDEVNWGEVQEVNGGEMVVQRLKEMGDYMIGKVWSDQEYEATRSKCKNKHSRCTYWASIGECEKNPSYMSMNCAPACYTCELLDIKLRCPVDKDKPGILGPGDLNQLFIRIVTDFKEYTPVIHSMPEPTSKEIISGPWVVTLDDFMSEEECDALIKHGKQLGYEPSYQFSGEFGEDGVEIRKTGTSRTSLNTWCMGQCSDDPLVMNVTKRIETITGVPEVNSEYLQLLEYSVGQFYKSHHDYIDYHLERPTGVRILTVFLYLNEPDEGGSTKFNDLDISVTPKKGKALIWPSVLNEDPNKKDPRTHHEAMPVQAGMKFGANAWLHQHDFKTSYDKNCH